MAEFDVPQTEVLPAKMPLPSPRIRSTDEEFGATPVVEPLPAAPAVREGLPAAYRMRADRHYIDHMTSESVGLPVRLIAVDRIDATSVSASDRLTRSIAAHGVLQPLLVRKRGGRYQLIAGRKRLASAMAAGLTSVPCLLHEVTEAEAAALADAENVLHIPAAAPPPAFPVSLAAVLQEVAADISALDRSTALLRTSGGFPYQRIAIDLIAAQAWRTSWLVNATAFLAAGRRTHTPFPLSSKTRPLAVVVDRVVHACAPAVRLLGGEIRTDLPPAASIAIDESTGELALTGALLATLSLLDRVEGPILGVQAQAQGGSVTLEVAQADVTPSPEWVRAFSTPDAVIKSPLIPGLAGSVLRAFSDQHNASMELRTPGEVGSVLRLTLRG